MSWFDEQLKYRKQIDDENFADSLKEVAAAIMGPGLEYALNESETASSAIAMALKSYGITVKDSDIRSDGSFEETLTRLIRPHGFMSRIVKLEKGWHKDAAGVMIASLKEDQRAITLLPNVFGSYSYFDPKTNKKTVLNSRNEELIDDEAVLLYRPLPLKSLSIKDLLKFMFEQIAPADFVLYLLLMGAGTLLGMLAPVFTHLLFGPIMESRNLEVLGALAVFYFCYILTKTLFMAYQSLWNMRISLRQNLAVQSAIMNRILCLPVSFFRNYSSGEMTQRATYLQSLCSTLFNTIGITTLTSLFSLAYIVSIFAYAPALVLPSIIVTLTTIAISLITTFLQMGITRKAMEAAAKTSGITYSMITGVQKIKLAGAQKRMFARFAKYYANEARYLYNPPLFLKLSPVLSLAVSSLGMIVLYYSAIKAGVSVADYYAFNSAYAMVSAAFTSIASIATTIASIKPVLEMSKPIMEAVPEVAENKEIVSSIHGDIELNHVSFRYEEDMPNVIDDLSLKIKHGQMVAIVGSTGCGKSTLMRLMLGFEKPQKGVISYDRKDITKLDMRSLRNKQIGVVMQDGKLFLGDIYANITIAAPERTLDDAWEAARLAEIAEDIKAMPMGMNTLISEGQGGISGGQKQRLMIARALVSKPKVLMFDEATSALDNVTQKAITKAIDKLKCTRIIIAHRLSTIRNADRIIFLDKGKIVEDGTYEELIELNGMFARLVERQRLDIETD